MNVILLIGIDSVLIEFGIAYAIDAFSFGNLVQEVKAPVSGYALYGLAGLPVKKGESVMTIAIEQ